VTDDVVEVRWRFRRRTARVVGVGAGVVALLGAWWVVSAQGVVETGSSSWSPGYSDECEFADDDIWALYAADDDVVAMQTVGNSAPWPVTVVSERPDAVRFGEVFNSFTSFPSEGAQQPSFAELTDRAVVPAGEEVLMWVSAPFPEDGSMPDGSIGINDRIGIDGADVQVWSLGIPHDTRIEFRGALWQSDLTAESPEFQRQLAEMCLDDE
jgi:hypothetical protein